MNVEEHIPQYIKNDLSNLKNLPLFNGKDEVVTTSTKLARMLNRPTQEIRNLLKYLESGELNIPNHRVCRSGMYAATKYHIVPIR